MFLVDAAIHFPFEVSQTHSIDFSRKFEDVFSI